MSDSDFEPDSNLDFSSENSDTDSDNDFIGNENHLAEIVQEMQSDDDMPLSTLRGRGSSRSSRGSSRGSRRGLNPRILDPYPPDGWSSSMPELPDISFASSVGTTPLCDNCVTPLDFFLLVLSAVDFWSIIVDNTNEYAASKEFEVTIERIDDHGQHEHPTFLNSSQLLKLPHSTFTYKLTFNSKCLVVDMQKKGDFDKVNNPAVSYDVLNKHCLRYGEVKDYPGSKALLDICDKMTGGIMMVDKYYYIEQVNTHLKNIHLISEMNSSRQNIDEKNQYMKKKHKRKKREADTIRYGIDLHILFDHSAYRRFDSNVDKIKSYMDVIVYMTNRQFSHQSLGIQIQIKLGKLDIATTKQKSNWVWASGYYTFLNATKWLEKNGENLDMLFIFTGKDTSDRKHGKRRMGFTKDASICSNESYGMVEILGFESARILVHEIGHALGLHHDEPLSCLNDTWKEQGTPNLYKINDDKLLFHMAKLDKGSVKHGWSKCSRHTLAKVIGSFPCMLKNEPIDFNAELPGSKELFNLDRQCEAHFGKTLRFWKQNKMKDCSYMWCAKKKDFQISQGYRLGWLDGTMCKGSSRMWCINTKCVSKYPMADGKWTKWSKWSSCSRTCGIGIRVKERDCKHTIPSMPGKPCIGDSLKHETCSTLPCPNQNEDFRDLQCTWEPGTRNISRDRLYFRASNANPGENPCAMYCYVHNRREPKRLYLDGTNCKPKLNDLCISGKCVQVGCDFFIESGVLSCDENTVYGGQTGGENYEEEEEEEEEETTTQNIPNTTTKKEDTRLIRWSYAGIKWSNCNDNCNGLSVKMSECMHVPSRTKMSRELCFGNRHSKQRSCSSTCSFTWHSYRVSECIADGCGTQGYANHINQCYKLNKGDDKVVNFKKCSSLERPPTEVVCQKVCAGSMKSSAKNLQANTKWTRWMSLFPAFIFFIAII